MKCQKCGADLQDDVRFCRECGQKVEQQIAYCRECGNKVAPGSKFCSNCGTKVSIDSDVQHSINEEDKTYEEQEEEQYFELPLAPKNSQEYSDSPDNFFERALQFTKRKIKEFWNKRSLYGKVITVFVSVFVFLGLIAFLFGKNTAGTIAIIQVVLTVVALLMKKQIIKGPKTWLHIVALGLAVVLLFPYVNLFRGNFRNVETATEATTEPTIEIATKPTIETAIEQIVEATTEPTIEVTEALEKLQWPRNPLAELIPIPTSEYGKVQYSNDDELQIWVDQVSKDDFDAYISACVEKGFTNIKKESNYEFEATNHDGYQLRLYHSNTDGMRITVKQPLYEVELTLDCIPNLLFNKYDVTAWVDDVEIASVVHGGESTVKLELEQGSHTLVVKKHGWKEPKGTVTFDIVANTIVTYQLSCGEDVISLKQTEYIELRELSETEARVSAAASELKYDNYKDVVDALTEAGFTNIKTNILYDIVWGWTSEGEVDSVSIAGNTDFKTGAIFNKDAEVVVTYHMNEDDDPSRIKMTKKASDYEGKNYSEVQKIFKDFGFMNIVLEKTETTDTSYDDGEVYRITIDYEHFEVGDAYKPDDKVLIKYYKVDATAGSTLETDPTKETTEYVETVLTVDNCEDLAKLIHMDWQKDRTAISNFASKYKGDTIRLEMLTAYVEQNGNYKTRFNYTLYAVEGENVMLSGPVFVFEDVNYYDLNLVGPNIPDAFGTGVHCEVKAKIVGFKDGMILLDPETITVIKVY